MRIFAFFLEKRSPSWKFSKFCSRLFIATPIYLLCSNFVKYGRREVDENVRCSPDKQKISPDSPALATAQISPKICQSHPQTMYSECSSFHPNRCTFGGVIPERVNIKTGRKVFPIFGWSPASSRIISKRTSVRTKLPSSIEYHILVFEPRSCEFGTFSCATRYDIQSIVCWFKSQLSSCSFKRDRRLNCSRMTDARRCWSTDDFVEARYTLSVPTVPSSNSVRLSVRHTPVLNRSSSNQRRIVACIRCLVF